MKLEDPICSRVVWLHTENIGFMPSRNHNGVMYYFCSTYCRGRFDRLVQHTRVCNLAASGQLFGEPLLYGLA